MSGEIDRASALAGQHAQKDIREAEERGRVAAVVDSRLDALEAHKRLVNGSLQRIDGSLVDIKLTLAGVLSAKKSVVSLQNRQVAFLAAAGTVVYLLVEHVH